MSPDPHRVEPPAGRTGADLLVAALAGAGVEVVFGLPGVHNLAAWNALDAAPGIRLVCVRHEQAAVYAADGYGRATGRLGVALVTTGPGAANTLGAVGEAWASRSPVLVIATDIPSSLRRSGVVGGALHEGADQAAMFAPVTKAAFRAAEAAQVGNLAARAGAAALAAPTRPVLLEVPADALTRDAAGPVEAVPAAPSCAWGEPDLAPAIDLIAAARRPLVWAGGGARDASPAVAALAERIGAPVLTTYGGRGVAGKSRCAVGLPPHLPRVGALWDAADLVIGVGTDFDGMSTQNWRMPAPPKLIAINVDEADGSKNYAPDAVLAGDAEQVCAALAAALAERDGAAMDLDALSAAARADLRDEHPAELAFLDAFAAAVPDEAIVLADMCIPGYWIAGFHRFTAPRRLQYPMGWGTLGYAFPASIGAALGAKGAVVSVSGDGGFLFACGELATVAQERLSLTTLVVDDGGYGMLRFDQRRTGAQTQYGIDLRTPDYVALARAFGLRAERVDGLGDAFARALAGHIADPEPTVLVAEAALQPPPTTSPRWYRQGPPNFNQEAGKIRPVA